jgi:hypothetical protein
VQNCADSIAKHGSYAPIAVTVFIMEAAGNLPLESSIFNAVVSPDVILVFHECIVFSQVGDISVFLMLSLIPSHKIRGMPDDSRLKRRCLYSVLANNSISSWESLHRGSFEAEHVCTASWTSAENLVAVNKQKQTSAMEYKAGILFSLILDRVMALRKENLIPE